MLATEDPPGSAGPIRFPGKQRRGHFGDQSRMGVHPGAEFRSEQAFAEGSLPVLPLSALLATVLGKRLVRQYKHESRLPGISGGVKFALAEGLLGTRR